MERDELLYVRHVLDAINTVEEYLQGVSESQFNKTRLLQDGVIRQIEIVGEAARHISKIYAVHILKFLGRMLQGCAINLSTIISALTLKKFG